MIANYRTGWLPAFFRTRFTLPRIAVTAFCCFVLGNATFAQQTAEEDIQRGDKQYNLYAYSLAMRSFEEAVKLEPENAYALGRLADCYVQLNQPEAALLWYERSAAAPKPDADLSLRYGKALMQTGDYANAKKWFVAYSETNPTLGKHFADMCDYALKTSGYAPLYVTKNETINSPASDYCPAFLGDRVVYSSARSDMQRKTTPKSAADWSGSAYNQLFVCRRDPATGMLQKAEFLRSDLQNNYNEGPVSFGADGAKLVYSRNNFIDGSRQMAEKGLNMSLFTADVTAEGNWQNFKAFPYNGSDYSTGYPHLSADGNTLFFASNQPEGLGGWDIYVCQRTPNGWSQPVNLGAPLNTPGNEITPHLDGTNLYFSSDYHRGMGGLDVFRADFKDDRVNGIYHLGPGINSSRDDYGFIYNSAQNIGYLTSNRPGGRGNEDIWQVTKKQPAAAATPPSAATKQEEVPPAKPAEPKPEPAKETTPQPAEKAEVKTNVAPPQAAKRTEIPADLNGYSVQVGAFPTETAASKTGQFETLSDRGNVYHREEGGMTKVRIGVYASKAEAQAVQKQLTAEGKIKGAFVVEERGVARNLAYASADDKNPQAAAQPETANIRFAVQLDVQAGDKSLAIHDYSQLASLGRIYTKNNEKGQISVRLGIWQTYDQAEAARVTAINKGFDHATVVQENASDPSIKQFLKAGDPALKAPATTADKPLEYFSVNAPKPSPTKYHIRLCALSDSNNFDKAKLGDVQGNIEKWAIGETGMTAIMLTGYTDEGTAVGIAEKVKGNFPDAYVVKEENGILTKLRTD